LVIYITGEGQRGARGRLIALRKKHGVEGQGTPFYLIADMPNLGSIAGDLKELHDEVKAAANGRKVAAIIIDTLIRAMPGCNENAAQDVSIFISNCESLARQFCCFVGAVHHSPRADDGRIRGSNAIDGALDVAISVTRQEATGVSTATVTAMRDGPPGLTWTFRPEPYPIDQSGEITAVTIRNLTKPKYGAEQPEKKKPNRKRLTDDQLRLITIIKSTIAETGQFVEGPDLVPPDVRAVTRTMLMERALRDQYLDPDGTPANERSKLGHALTRLAGRQIIEMSDQWVWVLGSAAMEPEP
jgi:hypothetical protein